MTMFRGNPFAEAMGDVVRDPHPNPSLGVLGGGSELEAGGLRSFSSPESLPISSGAILSSDYGDTFRVRSIVTTPNEAIEVETIAIDVGGPELQPVAGSDLVYDPVDGIYVTPEDMAIRDYLRSLPPEPTAPPPPPELPATGGDDAPHTHDPGGTGAEITDPTAPPAPLPEETLPDAGCELFFDVRWDPVSETLVPSTLHWSGSTFEIIE